MVAEIDAIEQRCNRSEISVEQRDLEQGKAAVRTVGKLGGSVVGGLVGAAISAEFPGAGAAAVSFGTTVGGGSGDTSAKVGTKLLPKLTRVTARKTRSLLSRIFGSSE
jgi:hypothetical protein